VQLSYNELGALPNELNNLVNLEILKAAKNKLYVLPSPLSNLRSLRIVDLSQNVLRSPGAGWFSKEHSLDHLHTLNSLYKLNMQGNQVLSSPFLFYLLKLS